MAFSLCSVINYGSSNTGVLFIKLRIILQQKLIKILYLIAKKIYLQRRDFLFKKHSWQYGLSL